MKEYRTDEQFREIMDSAYNGNFTQASEQAVECGFYAADFDRRFCEFGFDEGFEWTDALYVIEMATERRYK